MTSLDELREAFREAMYGRDWQSALAKRGVDAAALEDVGKDRVTKIYAHLTGQMPGPLRETTAVEVHRGAIEVLGTAWRRGFLTSLYLDHSDEPSPELGLLQLAEGARSLDSLSEESGGESVWSRFDISADEVASLAISLGQALQPELRRQKSPLPSEKLIEMSALAAVFQDGLASGLLSAEIAARASQGSGPRAGERPPAEEM